MSIQRALLAVAPFILAVTYYFSLWSVEEAEESDTLSPEEMKRRLTLLLPKMDLDGDQQINQHELKKWIQNAFFKLSQEEMQERMSEVDDNMDGEVSWTEYLQDFNGPREKTLSEMADVNSDRAVSMCNDSLYTDTTPSMFSYMDGVVSWTEYLQDFNGPREKTDSEMFLTEEKAMWAAADENGDGKLNMLEYEVFTNPEKHVQMHTFIVKQTLREKDTNKDGKIDFNEYVGDRGDGVQHEKGWLISQKEKFDYELDLNQDGVLDESEIHAWVIPNNEETATQELNHLFASADDNHDDQGSVSIAEILNYHEVFVGNEATDYGRDNKKKHFDDEL